jgi:uncharacterized protein YndB with AHSA1/START domain
MKRKPEHATIPLEGTYHAPIERVFSEFADPLGRARWSASTGDVLIYDPTEFREGGARHIPKMTQGFKGVTFYHLRVPTSV